MKNWSADSGPFNSGVFTIIVYFYFSDDFDISQKPQFDPPILKSQTFD